MRKNATVLLMNLKRKNVKSYRYTKRHIRRQLFAEETKCLKLLLWYQNNYINLELNPLIKTNLEASKDGNNGLFVWIGTVGNFRAKPLQVAISLTSLTQIASSPSPIIKAFYSLKWYHNLNPLQIRS
ncbi:hypothetical protein ScPMuIL_005372 [Solemya velum]